MKPKVTGINNLQSLLDAKLDDSQASALGLALLGAAAASDATALLAAFTTSLKGLVPPPFISTGKFLRDDGTWADALAGGGVGVADGDKGDITVSGTGVVWTIDPGTITLAKMANLSAYSFIGNNTGSAAAPLALSTTQATSLLNTFTTALKGLVPPPTTATGKYLKDDGTWDIPSGSGVTTIDALSDVNTSSVAPTNGQALIYETSSSQWKPGNIASTTFSGAKVKLTANSTSATGDRNPFTTGGATVVYDSATWWDATNKQFTVPSGVTRVRVTGQCYTTVTTGTRGWRIGKNTVANHVALIDTVAGVSFSNITADIDVVAGDIIIPTVNTSTAQIVGIGTGTDSWTWISIASLNSVKGDKGDPAALANIDVTSSPPSHGQALVYDGVTGLWKPSATASAIGDLIAEYACDGSQATYNFNSIPQNYKDLVLEINGRTVAATINSIVNITVNNLATGYDWQRTYGNATTTTSDSGLNSSVYGGFLSIPGTTTASGFAGSAEVTFSSYANTTYYKAIRSHARYNVNATGDVGYNLLTAGQSRNTAAITSIQIVCTGGAFAAGSTIRLYGRGGTSGGGNGTASMTTFDPSGTSLVATNVQSALVALAGAVTSPATVRTVQIAVTDPTGDVVITGDGKAYFRVPLHLNGYKLTSVAAAVTTPSTSGIPTVQIANATTLVDMLTTKLTIDVAESDTLSAAIPAVIDTANNTVNTGNLIRIDVDVAGTNTKGLIVDMTFTAP